MDLTKAVESFRLLSEAKRAKQPKRAYSAAFLSAFERFLRATTARGTNYDYDEAQAALDDLEELSPPNEIPADFVRSVIDLWHRKLDKHSLVEPAMDYVASAASVYADQHLPQFRRLL